MSERFLIRNYGPSRNLPDGHGSYIFIEHERVRSTSDPELAKLFTTYPQIHVTDRGEEAFPAPVLPEPPVGPEPPEDEDEAEDEDEDEVEDEVEDEAADYSDLAVKDLREIAQERDIPIVGLLKADLIRTLQENDAASTDEWRVGQPVKYEDEDEIYHIVSVPEEADGEFIIKNDEQEEYSALADQLAVVE